MPKIFGSLSSKTPAERMPPLSPHIQRAGRYQRTWEDVDAEDLNSDCKRDMEITGRSTVVEGEVQGAQLAGWCELVVGWRARVACRDAAKLQERLQA